jgi:signal transduction histidine kinase
VTGRVPWVGMRCASFIGWVRALARHDTTLVVVLMVLAGLGASFGPGHFNAAEVLGGEAICLPLAGRTRWPATTLAVVVAGSVLYLALAHLSGAFVPAVLVALYTFAASGTRRGTVIIAAAGLLAAIVAVLVFSPGTGTRVGKILGQSAFFGLALAVGEGVRSRRAFLGAMEDRVERAAREHELEARRRVAEERMRIARDVHDVVSHSIATISTQASVGVHIGRTEPERAREALASIKEVSAGALADLRHALGVLRDESDGDPAEPTPSLHEVPALVHHARSAGLGVELRMEGSVTELPAALQVAVYRIVQESLTNVMRHARGAHATVLIAVGPSEVGIEVTNDGSGAPTPDSGDGARSGLRGMRERAGALGGELEAGPQPGGGFRVRAVLPLGRPAVALARSAPPLEHVGP